MYWDTKFSETKDTIRTMWYVSQTAQQVQVDITYFNAEVATIDIVAKKKISRICWIATNLEKLHQIKILAMHIATNSDGCVHF